MKRTIITCDMCGKDITHEGRRYKFKYYNVMHYGRSEFFKWRKMEMCEECYKKVEHYNAHKIEVEKIIDKIRYLGRAEGTLFYISIDDLKRVENLFVEGKE